MKTLIAAACAVLAAGSVWAARPDYTTFISHRGESVDAPENTMPAYRMAVDRGFGFECDVYLSSDGQVFTFHDGTLERTTSGACTKKCGEASWADEISKLDVGGWGKWKGSKYSPTRPALLSELLTLARDGRQIYIEVKSGAGVKIVPYIKDILAHQKKATPRNVLFICFDRKITKALKEQMPEYKAYWLVSPLKGPKTKRVPFTAEEVIAVLKETHADGVDCHYIPDVVTADYIARVKAAGYEFHVWTVDRLAKSLEAFERGAQTVTTNCAKKQLDEYLASQKH